MIGHNSDMQAIVNAGLTPQPTDTPIPTPTTISLKTQQGIEAYAGQVLDNLSSTPYGSREGIAYTENTRELQVSFYIPSSQVWDSNNLKDMIEINCFNVQQALWTSMLKGIVSSIRVHIQSDLVDKYGNQSKGEVDIVKLVNTTENMVQWNNIDFNSAWDNQIYDEQWMLSSVKNS